MRRPLAVAVVCALVVLSGCVGGSLPEAPSSDDSTDEPSDEPTDESSSDADGELAVHHIDVGQADATLLRTDEETMLVDSGDWHDDGDRVIEYLEAAGVERIDHLVATHGHADHVGGHAAIIDHYETERDGVGAVYDSGVPHTSQTYERYLDAVERHDVTLYEVAEGDRVPFEGTEATVLNPEEPGGDDLHDDGVALRVGFGETAFLFTGDAERDAESRMVDAHGDDLDADVYQAGHHGSDTSSSDAFLDAVDPAVAVVSSAYDSEYGHPHQETLERFGDRDVRTAWTATHGTTVVVSDGRALSVRTQRNATTDPLEIRDAPASDAAVDDPTEERFVVGAVGPSAAAFEVVAPRWGVPAAPEVVGS